MTRTRAALASAVMALLSTVPGGFASEPATCAESATCAKGAAGATRAAPRALPSDVVLLQVRPAQLSVKAPKRGDETDCHFPLPPELPYYWEPTCTMGKLGCWADSIHAECRFCGETPYTGIPCPSFAVTPDVRTCRFPDPPDMPYYWDAQCQMGELGCFADNQHVGCRFCGVGAYASIPCPDSVCTFPNEPRTPYYWDPDCAMGIIGCNADGIHTECRFCRKRPFDPVKCPESLTVPQGQCTFPGLEPTTPYYWDPDCEFGKLGCWADGLNAECRWCGQDGYQDVPCPGAARWADGRMGHGRSGLPAR